MSRKATHRGTCQACGRVQMLPADTLSLHGYTKQWGWFAGTCFGSRCLPLEISKDLIEVCIKRSEQAIKALQAERAGLIVIPTPETKAWKHIYVSASRGSRYEWKLGTITEQTQTYGDTKVTSWIWTGEQTAREVEMKIKPLTDVIRSYDMMDVKGVVGVITQLNYKYVLSVVDAGIKNHKSYIQWQRERIKDWSPKPLMPLIAK